MQQATNDSESDRWGGKEPYVRVSDGSKFPLGRPRAWNPSVIAYHLAGINRYTGGSRYTVAQHCVVASRMAARHYPDNALLPARMLVHDAHECHYGDVSTPLKAVIGSRWKEVEQEAMLSMEQFCDLTFVGDPLVREIDYRMWLTERLCDIGCPYDSAQMREDYTGDLLPFPVEAADDSFECWSAEEAEVEWLLSFRRLLPWVKW